MTGPDPARAGTPGTSGIDLARVALRAARAAAAQSAGRPALAPRARQARRSDGRDPLGLAAVIEGLVAARAWQAPAAGAGILADWERIAPNLAGHVQAAAFDPATGRLDLRPDSASWATHLRLQTPALLRRIADHTGTTTVRTIRVLAPAARTSSAGPIAVDDTDIAPAPTPPAARREPLAGYREAVAAHRAAVPEQQLAPGVWAAIERQDQALAWHREPEEVFRAVLVDQDQEAAQAGPGGRSDAYRRAREQAARDRAARSLPTIASASSALPAPLRDTA
ncbi:DciA family protein [Streptodolium elevatio]